MRLPRKLGLARPAAAGLAPTFKFIQSAQDRWRAVNVPRLVVLVGATATFVTANSSNARRRRRAGI